MHFEIGPVMSLRSTEKNSWKISILVGSKDDEITKPKVSEDAISVSNATILTTFGKCQVYRIDLDIPLQDDARQVTYTFDERNWEFTVPGKS